MQTETHIEYTVRRMGPLDAESHLVTHGTCIGCQESFEAGDWVTIIPIGPADDPEAREKAREGRAYNAVGKVAHWACVTGEEPDDG